MVRRLQGKIALVTGGTRGIGRATCERLASEGAHVVVSSRSREGSEEVARAIVAAGGGEALGVRLDVRDTASVTAAVEEVLARLGRIDVLVNNAGVNADASLGKLTDEAWERVVDVSLGGTMRVTRAVAPHMASRQSGAILNCSSVVAHDGNFGQTNYIAAKAGVAGMTRVWAREYGRKGVRVNCVAPGFIATDMTARMPEEALAKMKAQTPLGRLGTPDDVARLYAFLASDEAAFIHGQVIGVDGGLVIGT